MDFDKDELKLLIHQFLVELDGEKYRETFQMLERESRLFFDIKYFGESVSNGDWEEVEKYLSRFTNPEDNLESFNIFFEIRRQNYYEAHDNGDRKKMLDILKRDLEVFTFSQADLYRGLAPLLQLNNFRKQEKFSDHGDEKSARILLMAKLKQLIKANPLIRDKLQFPTFQKSRLETLVKQSLSWQIQQCDNKGSNHKLSKHLLYEDHYCEQATDTSTPSPVAHGISLTTAF